MTAASVIVRLFMSRIRHFKLDDIPQVAALWLRTWRNSARAVPDSLLAYFNRIYFENPWVDLGVSSLVHESGTGRIDGFVGLMPRPMLLNGRKILAAVSCGLMVALEVRRQGIGLALRESSFKGPQDLLFTDGAAATARGVWEKAGGQLCLLHSCRWSRTLLPASSFVEKIERRIGAVAAPFHYPAKLFDNLAMRSRIGAYRLPENDLGAVEVEGAAEILGLRDELEPLAELRPVYDEQSFTWLLAETAEAKARGTLEKIVVTDSSGERIGWYVYFANPRGISDVMQIGGHPERIGDVVGHLMARAKGRGSLALSGQFDARYAHALAKAGCKFTSGSSFFVYSRDANILKTVQSGQTSLSRLDGEWWLHFADGPW